MQVLLYNCSPKQRVEKMMEKRRERHAQEHQREQESDKKIKLNKKSQIIFK